MNFEVKCAYHKVMFFTKYLTLIPKCAHIN